MNVHPTNGRAEIIAGERPAQPVTIVPMRPLSTYWRVYYLQFGAALGRGSSKRRPERSRQPVRLHYGGFPLRPLYRACVGAVEEQWYPYRPNRAVARTQVGRRSAPARPAPPGRPQVVAALRTEARVHIEGDVSDRRLVPQRRIRGRPDAAHHPEGSVALLEELLQIGPLGRHLHTPHAPQARPGEVE